MRIDTLPHLDYCFIGMNKYDPLDFLPSSCYFGERGLMSESRNWDRGRRRGSVSGSLNIEGPGWNLRGRGYSHEVALQPIGDGISYLVGA